MMLTLIIMMQVMKMPIQKNGDDDVDDHNCDVADVVEHDDDGVDEDDDNHDNDAEGNDDGGDDDDDDADKPIASSEQFEVSSEYAFKQV